MPEAEVLVLLGDALACHKEDEQVDSSGSAPNVLLGLLDSLGPLFVSYFGMSAFLGVRPQLSEPVVRIALRHVEQGASQVVVAIRQGVFQN